MELPYKIADDKKSICVLNGYTNYLAEIHKEIIDNQISILNYKSYDNIGTNFDFPNNPIEEIIYTRLSLKDGTTKFQKQNFNNLPEKLRILKLKSVDIDCYKLDNLPSGLKNLYLPNSYYYELDNLPLELEYLSLQVSNNFIQSLDYLPETLKKLKIIFPENNNRIKINCDNLPNGLEKLFLCGSINCELNNLPRNLKTLHLAQTHYYMIYNLPDGIEELQIPIDYKYLREIFSSMDTIKLKKLIIGFRNAFRIPSSFDLQSIPTSVEEIEFGDDFYQKLTWLPPKLKKITFGFHYNQPISYGNLPDSIEYIEFGCCFNNTVGKYPSNLKVLKFGRNYSSKIDNLPNGLMELEINGRLNSILTNLPTTLEILRFNEYAEYPNLDKLELPDSIKILQLGKYQKLQCIKNIPKSLEYIKYSESNEKITKLIKKTEWVGKIQYW